jgi:predicted nucleic acid-binding protein
VYDTRFFVEYFYSENDELLKKLKEELRSVKERIVSTVTIHEIHRINMLREGKAVAALRSKAIHGDFIVVDVNYETAVKSAELRNRHQMPMADAVVAVTAQIHDCPLFTDDAHFNQVQNLKMRWCKAP